MYIAVLFEKKNYVMVLLHCPLKNFERTWKRSQTQRSGNEKSETRSSEKLDRQNLKRDRVEKIPQFRRIADLQNNLRKEMYKLATVAHGQYSRSK